MAFPLVNKGGRFIPSASKENAVSRLLNSTNGAFSAMPIKGSDEQSYQFTIRISNKKICVVDGVNPKSDTCGTLNGTDIPKAEIAISGDGTYYVYAVVPPENKQDSKIVALDHKIADDLVPILLCGIVTINGEDIKVVQSNKENNPVVDVKDPAAGNVTVDSDVTLDVNSIEIKHSISGKIQHNNTVFEIPETELKQGASMRCNVYAEELTVENGVTPTVGFEIVSAGSAAHDFDLEVMRYSLYDTGLFYILGRNSNPQVFTFTIIALNSNEVNNE